jgi:hypothetical protein
MTHAIVRQLHRLLRLSALSVGLCLGACQAPNPVAYFREQPTSFIHSKNEVLRFIRLTKPSLPIELDTAFMRERGGFATTLTLAQPLQLTSIEVRQDGSLRYRLAPQEHFFSTLVRHFSYQDPSPIPLSDQHVISLTPTWSYTERLTNVAQ